MAVTVTFGVGQTFALSRILRASGGAGSIYDPDWPSFVIRVAIVELVGALATVVPSRRVMPIEPAAVLGNA